MMYLLQMPEYKKYPYRSEFPYSTERASNHQTLEDALSHVRWTFYWVWKQDGEYGKQGDYVNDTPRALITNRNTGYRWLLCRGDQRVEFQTPQMLEDQVARQSIQVHLTIEEAEALAAAAKVAITDKRTQALSTQALDQIAFLCRRVRERVRLGDDFIDAWTSSIPRRDPLRETTEDPNNEDQPEKRPLLRYRPLGDPDNLSLKEAGEILGKARNTIYGWYRSGKFPPAVDVSAYLGGGQNKPVIVVPRYRLEAWQKGGPMPEILQAVFDTHGLNEKPWLCFRPRKGTTRQDIDFWVERRNLTRATTKSGLVVYGDGLDPNQTYEPRGLVR